MSKKHNPLGPVPAFSFTLNGFFTDGVRVMLRGESSHSACNSLFSEKEKKDTLHAPYLSLTSLNFLLIPSGRKITNGKDKHLLGYRRRYLSGKLGTHSRSQAPCVVRWVSSQTQHPWYEHGTGIADAYQPSRREQPRSVSLPGSSSHTLRHT